MPLGHLGHCANLFLMIVICPSEPRGVYTRLVCYQPFCMEANVGHLSFTTLRDWIAFTIGVLELF